MDGNSTLLHVSHASGSERGICIRTAREGGNRDGILFAVNLDCVLTGERREWEREKERGGRGEGEGRRGRGEGEG